MSRIAAHLPSANLDTMVLNLIDLDSIKRFSEIFTKKYSRLDVLLNNAGVVNLEKREGTSSNPEMHMATNHFGHFALTGRLFPLLPGTKDSRVVINRAATDLSVKPLEFYGPRRLMWGARRSSRLC